MQPGVARNRSGTEGLALHTAAITIEVGPPPPPLKRSASEKEHASASARLGQGLPPPPPPHKHAVADPARAVSPPPPPKKGRGQEQEQAQSDETPALKAKWRLSRKLRLLAARLSRSLKTGQLELYSIGMRRVPAEVWRQTHITTLRLTDNGIENLDAGIGSLVNLCELSLRGNRLTALPDELGNLTKLTWLTIGRNQLVEIPATLCSLTLLRELYCGSNQLSSLPQQFSRLQNLEVLDLGSNRFTAGPLPVAALPNMQWINLRDNPLPLSVQVLYSAMVARYSALNMRASCLSHVPPDLAFARHVQILTLSHNRLTEFPECLARLGSHLVTLDISGNDFEELPDWVGTEMTALQSLDVSSCGLAVLPGSIAKLPQLSFLGLAENMLVELPSDLGLSSSLKTITLQSNPIRTPPMTTVKRGTQAVLRFLEDLHNQSSPAMFKSKVFVLGEPRAGKTFLLQRMRSTLNQQGRRGPRRLKKLVSTIKRTASAAASAAASGAGAVAAGKRPSSRMSAASLCDEPDEGGHDPTLGISTTEWMPGVIPQNATTERQIEAARQLTLSLWDMAGHPIYLPTHQIFLQKRALYIIVYSLVAFEADHVRFWMNCIQSRAPGAPVILVGTHADSAAADSLRSTRQWLQMHFGAEAMAEASPGQPRVVRQAEVDSQSGSGIMSLCELLVEEALAQAHMGERIPHTYLEMELCVRQMQEASRMGLTTSLPLQPFNVFAAQINKTLPGLSIAEIVRASQFLNDWGILLYFGDDTDQALRGLVVYDPAWLAETVFPEIVSLRGRLLCPDGILSATQLREGELWPGHSMETRVSLLRMLELFEIAVEHSERLGRRRVSLSECSYVIPCLLPAGGPSVAEWLGAKAGKPGSSRNAPRQIDMASRVQLSKSNSADKHHSAAVPRSGPVELLSSATIEARRRFKFDFVPKGFIPRLMVKLLNAMRGSAAMSECTVRVWHYCICVEGGPGNKDGVLLEMVDSDGKRARLTWDMPAAKRPNTLCVFTKTAKDFGIMSMLRLQMRQYVDTWYPGVQYSVSGTSSLRRESAEAAKRKAGDTPAAGEATAPSTTSVSLK